VRSIILNAATHEPLADPVAGTPAAPPATAQVQILGPLGNIVATGGSTSTNSISAFNWTIPETAAGGEYTLKITYPRQAYAPARRTTPTNASRSTGLIPKPAAGGEYTLKITSPRQGYAPAQRKFDVRVYRAPRLRSQITFARDGYGASDKVTATLHTERAEGG